MGNVFEKLGGIEKQPSVELNQGYFNDGIRTVDYILVYADDPKRRDDRQKRTVYEENLIKCGLELEYDTSQSIMSFVKIHANNDILYHYAEILKFKMPLKPIPGQSEIAKAPPELMLINFFHKICRKNYLDRNKLPKSPERIYCEFSRNYLHIFESDNPNFFDEFARINLIACILERTRFVQYYDAQNVGIERLLEDKVYEAAYPLHREEPRALLKEEWASLRRLLKEQPLDQIKSYFGPQIALYFAWIDFYTYMLIPLSVFGILCQFYSIATWHWDEVSQQICVDAENVLMCPLCDYYCDFWKLQDTCFSARLNYLIDNGMTSVFAFALSIWSVFFLDLWKSYSASLIHHWGLSGFTTEFQKPLPKYIAKLRKSRRMKSILDDMQIVEPDVPFWKYKFCPLFASYSITLLCICLSMIAMTSVVVYRMAQSATRRVLGDESLTSTILLLPVTASFIDFVIMTILDFSYAALAKHLTNLEFCRSQLEYDESLTLKNFLFQFLNYYSTLFYIAFFKGNFVGTPNRYWRIFGFRQEECNPGGCLIELCVQLVVVLTGKQIINDLLDMYGPVVTESLRKLFRHIGYRRHPRSPKFIVNTSWHADYLLVPYTGITMFDEYLKLVIQYGFLTIFGLAFPLTPVLALVSNIFETRVVAIRIIKYLQRPVTRRCKDIGVWFKIMKILTKIAVFSSAMTIAFSTNMIPKLVYYYHNNRLKGYVNFTLAYFDTKDFEIAPILPNSPYKDVKTCRYHNFRNPPEHPRRPYGYSQHFWEILFGRLLFIALYQNIIGIIQTLLSWAIPAESEALRKRRREEEYLLREYLIERAPPESN